MVFIEFVNRWVCNDNWGMLGYQGTITFSGINAIFTFPPKGTEKGINQIYAISLAEIEDEDFKVILKEIDESLINYYELT